MPSKEPTTQSTKVEKALEHVPPETEALVAIMLEHALEAEGNFLALYDVAIRKAQAGEAKEKLRAFRGDHERHVQEIRGALDQLGHGSSLGDLEPTPHALALAEQLESTTSDEQLLTAFLATEGFSRELYAWLGSIAAPEPVARVAQRGLDDEARHYAWAAKQLGLEAR